MTYRCDAAVQVFERMEPATFLGGSMSVREIPDESAGTDASEHSFFDELPQAERLPRAAWEQKMETGGEPPASALAYELPADLLAAYHRLLDKKFGEGLTHEEEAEFERVGKELDEADMRTPLRQAVMQRAEEEHQRWMTTLEEVIAKLRSLRKSL